jgi:hypothetical protein
MAETDMSIFRNLPLDCVNIIINYIRCKGCNKLIEHMQSDICKDCNFVKNEYLKT